MYSEEELREKKYGDLLKILKKLGIKGGRQKTEKVIELILQCQNAANENEFETTVPDSTLLDEETHSAEISINCSVVEANKLEIAPSPRLSVIKRSSRITKRATRSSLLNLSALMDDVDNGAKNSNNKEKLIADQSMSDDNQQNKDQSLSRSDTFILEVGLPDDSLTASLDLKMPLNRSLTFTLEDKDNKRSKEEIQSSISPDKKMDLCCSEVQTAEDIESIENGIDRDFVFIDIPSNAGSKVKRARRSLRGQLLESKMYLKESPMPSLSENESISEKMDSVVQENSNPSIGENSSIQTFRKENFNIPKSFDFGGKNPVDKNSGIPRFVSYARKLKMPNFARIHENAFNKMEALDEYVERKHARTKSATAEIATAVASSAKKELGSHVNRRKQNKLKLTFSESKTLQLVTNRSTGMRTPGSVSKRRSSTLVSPKPVSPTSGVKSNIPSKIVPPAITTGCALPRLVKENLPPKTNISIQWNKPETCPNTPSSFQRRKSYVPTPSKSQISSRKVKIDVTQLNVSTQPGNFTYTRRRSGETKNISRMDALKKAAKRRPNVKSSAEIRASEKVFIKGVRTNRRFELQMAKRGIGPV